MARKTKAAQMTKRCTKTGEEFTGTFDELTEFFYRDKSQKDGLSPWCKAAERAYNKAYRTGLKDADAPRKADINEDEAMGAFESAMAPERVTRRKGTESKQEAQVKKAARKATAKKQDGKRTAKAKDTTKKRKAARARKTKAQASA